MTKSKKSSKKARRFVTRYRHWRTGKIMIASEYGYKCWPIFR